MATALVSSTGCTTQELAEFFAVDPLTADYPWNSPYAFSENDLIRAVELEGLEKKIIIHDTKSDGSTYNQGAAEKDGLSMDMVSEKSNHL